MLEHQDAAENALEHKPIGEQPIWQAICHSLNIGLDTLDKRVLSQLPDQLSQTVSRQTLSTPLRTMSFVQHYDEAKSNGSSYPALDAISRTAADEAVSLLIPTPLTVGVAVADKFGKMISDTPKHFREAAAEIDDTTIGSRMLKNSLEEQAFEAQLLSQAMRFPQAVLDRTTSTISDALQTGAQKTFDVLKASGQAIAEQELREEAARQETWRFIADKTRDAISAGREGIHSLGEKVTAQGVELQEHGKQTIHQGGLLDTYLGYDAYKEGLGQRTFGDFLQSIGKPLTNRPIASSLSSPTIAPNSSFFRASSVVKHERVAETSSPGKEDSVEPPAKLPRLFSQSRDLGEDVPTLSLQNMPKMTSPKNPDTEVSPVLTPTGDIGLGVTTTTINRATLGAQVTSGGLALSASVPTTGLLGNAAATAAPIAAGVAAIGGTILVGGLIYDKIKHRYRHVRDLSRTQISSSIQEFEDSHKISLDFGERAELTSILQGLHRADQEIVNARKRITRNKSKWRFGMGHVKRAQQLQQESIAEQQTWQQRRHNFEIAYGSYTSNLTP